MEFTSETLAATPSPLPPATRSQTTEPWNIRALTPQTSPGFFSGCCLCPGVEDVTGAGQAEHWRLTALFDGNMDFSTRAQKEKS